MVVLPLEVFFGSYWKWDFNICVILFLWALDRKSRGIVLELIKEFGIWHIFTFYILFKNLINNNRWMSLWREGLSTHFSRRRDQALKSEIIWLQCMFFTLELWMDMYEYAVSEFRLSRLSSALKKLNFIPCSSITF